jgi:hypothetical protein
MFDRRPDFEAVETVELHEQDGVTTMTVLLAFKDQPSRDASPWTAADGVNAAVRRTQRGRAVGRNTGPRDLRP